jgi:hypothetical protein
MTGEVTAMYIKTSQARGLGGLRLLAAKVAGTKSDTSQK